MDPRQLWVRRVNFIALESEDAGLLLLGDGAEQPVHLGDHGAALWEQLEVPRTVTELAERLAPEQPRDQVCDEIHSVLKGLAALSVCEVRSDGEESHPKGLG